MKTVFLVEMNRFGLVILLTAICSACSISRPCTEAGDVSWNPRILGDKRCTQKRQPDGRIVNHGKFTQAYASNGRIALEGSFDEGRKSGIWLYYAEDGHLISAKYFDRGVEKTPPPEFQQKIDLLIQQKAGMK
jgi:hypothetical protein